MISLINEISFLISRSQPIQRQNPQQQKFIVLNSASSPSTSNFVKIQGQTSIQKIQPTQKIYMVNQPQRTTYVTPSSSSQSPPQLEDLSHLA